MRWTPGGVSGDIEDRRGGGGFGGMGGFGGLGIVGTLVLFVLSICVRADLFSVLGVAPGAAPTQERCRSVSDPSEDRQVQFVSFVLDDAQRTWASLLPDRYQRARLVLFRDVVQSACGTAQSA